jgi:hypothetical protein
VDDAVTGRTFYYFGSFNVCEACKDNLEVQIKGTVRTKDPFTYDWYNKLILDNLGKAVSKGK